MTSLSSTAFIGCTSLTTYNVPDSFREISNNCFGGAPSISTVNIASNLAISKIVSNAFSSIPMTSINFGTGTTVSLIDDSAFLNSRISSFNVNSPMTISNNAFKGCTNLNSINVNGATSIGNNAFEGCTNLQSFSLNTNVRLSSFVFKGCTKLKSVNLPNMISSSIPSYYMSKRMTKATSYTSIPVGLFDGCSSLSSLNINNNIVNISDYAFRDCVSLSYIIPYTVSYIGDESFKNCHLIRDIPKNVVYFGNYSFYGTNIGKSILINRDTKYIGASSFINTPLRVVYYCGERDFSKFSPSFNTDTNVVVTFSYNYPTFCGTQAIYLPSNTCKDIMRTNNDGFDHLKKQVKEKMKSNSALLVLSMNSLGLF